MGRSVRRLVRSVTTHVFCAGNVYQNGYYQVIFERNIIAGIFQRGTVSEVTISLEQGSGSGIGINGKEGLLPPDPFSLAGVRIYRQSFTSQRTVLLKPTEALFEC